MADLHRQPTQEELDAQIKKSQEEIEKLEKESADTPDEKEEKPTEEEEKEIAVTPDEKEEVSDEEEEIEEEVEEEKEEEIEEVKEPETKEPDITERYRESTREAQILAAKNKKMNQAIEEAAVLPEPTDEDLQQEARIQGFNFDDMDDIQKALFRKSIHNDRKLAKISEVSKETKDWEAWNKKVDEYIDNPKTILANPRLEGRQNEFKTFAAKESRRGVNFEDLVASFLYHVDKSRPKNKGAMFETGHGGEKKQLKPKSDKISLAEADKIRQTNFNKWKELLMADKIDSSTV